MNYETLGLDTNAWPKTWACTTLKQPHRLTNSSGVWRPFQSYQTLVWRPYPLCFESVRCVLFHSYGRWENTLRWLRLTVPCHAGLTNDSFCSLMPGDGVQNKYEGNFLQHLVSPYNVFHEQHLLHPFWCVSITGSIKQSRKEPADTNGPTFSYFPKPDTWQILRVFMG